MKKCFVAALLSLSSLGCLAIDFVNVPDASLLKWQLTPNGTVFLRNLNDFDPTFLGCCYNYSLDSTTPAGKALWATILLKIATSKPISIGVADKALPSAVAYTGNH